MTQKLSVVIPAFDYWLQTQRCIDSLLACDLENIEIIVVDHGLTEETRQGLAQYPRVIRMAASSSLWWTGATNLGIRAALERGASLVMLLNSDCYVEQDTVTTLLRHHSGVGDAVIAPVQKNARDDSIIPYWGSTCFLLGFPTLILPKIGNREGVVPVPLIMGGRGVVIPREVLNKVGLFDEDNLPHYGADHDFYLRCCKQDIRLLVATDARVYVDDNRTTLASAYGNMSWRQFTRSFKDRRSHRNVYDLTALFKRHYPIKGLHYIGVGLNLFRYTLIYLWYRIKNLVLGGRH